MVLEQLRKKAGLTQEQLSKLIGVNQTAISQWEKGRTCPTSDKLPELAKALGCSIEELFKEEKKEG